MCIIHEEPGDCSAALLMLQILHQARVHLEAAQYHSSLANGKCGAWGYAIIASRKVVLATN